MQYARKPLQVYQVIEDFEALVSEFFLSAKNTRSLCQGQISNYQKLEKHCDALRKDLCESQGFSFRDKSSMSFSRPDMRALAHDAILTYQQCNSRNKDLSKAITAAELLFVCRRLKRNLERCKQQKVYDEVNADRVFRALRGYGDGLIIINRCNKCTYTFAVKVDNNTQSNCTNCYTMKKRKSMKIAASDTNVDIDEHMLGRETAI